MKTTKSKTISLRVKEEVSEYLSVESKKLGISKSDFIVSAVLKKDTYVNIEDKKRNFHLNKISNLLEIISNNIKITDVNSFAILEQLILVEKECKAL